MRWLKLDFILALFVVSLLGLCACSSNVDVSVDGTSEKTVDASYRKVYSYDLILLDGEHASVVEEVSFENGYSKNTTMTACFDNHSAAEAFVDRIRFDYGDSLLDNSVDGCSARVVVSLLDKSFSPLEYEMLLSNVVNNLEVGE